MQAACVRNVSSPSRANTYMARSTGISALVQQGRANLGVAVVQRISMVSAELTGDFLLGQGDAITLFFRVSGMLPLKATANVVRTAGDRIVVEFTEIEPAMRDIINRTLLADLSAQFRGARDALQIR